jgi:hypothetical protein
VSILPVPDFRAIEGDTMIRPLLRTAAVAALLTLSVSVSPPTRAVEAGSYKLEVLVDGVSLEELRSRGASYVEAIEGCEYSIRLTNRTSERVAIALSVDGLNSIDAKTTTARSASKWILAPHSTITIDGWQTGSSTARSFFFTTEAESYGAWLGKTSNLGIVAAAVFREKRPLPAPIQRQDAPAREKSRRSAGQPSAAAESALDDEMAATGIGREIDHRVQRVAFDAERSPNAVLELRYEYRDALVRLGVVPKPSAQHEQALARRERARGFAELDFAPDPFRNP